MYFVRIFSVFLVSLFVSAKGYTQCTGCDVTNPGTNINSSSNGETICITSHPGGNINLTASHTDVTIKICVDNVTLNTFDVGTAANGLHIVSYADNTVASLQNVNGNATFSVYGGGTMDINTNASTQAVSLVVGEGSTMYSEATTYKNCTIEIQEGATLYSDGTSNMSLDQDITITNKGTWELTNSLYIKSPDATLNNGCGESETIINAFLVITNGSVLNNGSIYVNNGFYVGANTTQLDMAEGASLSVKKIQEWNALNAMTYSGDASSCANIINRESSVNNWNQDLTTSSNIYYNGPATGAKLGSATASSSNCTGDLIYCDAALPIDLGVFYVQKENNNAVLYWNTFSEKNNSHFIIEKSTDGMNFESIGTVEGAENSSVLQQYTFTDNDLTASITYYRIVQVDFDGQFSTGPIRSVSLNGTFDVIAFPQPGTVDDMILQVKNETNETSIISVIDELGRELYSTIASHEKGDVLISLGDEIELAAGLYIVRVVSGSDSKTKKIIIK